MGKFAGERALGYLSNSPHRLPAADTGLCSQRFSDYLEASGQDNIGQIRDALRNVMTEQMSIFRNEDGMRKTIDTLNELKSRADKTALSSQSLRMNQELVQHWEVDNLLVVAMVTTQAALHRKESRGAHFREDFPERSDAFNYHSLITMAQFGEVVLGKRKVDMSRFEEGGEHADKFGLIERKY
jgi:succinate dehydrogenase / fumarate reductase flavoprotein subunit